MITMNNKIKKNKMKILERINLKFQELSLVELTAKFVFE